MNQWHNKKILIAKNSHFCYPISMESDKNITPEDIQAAKTILTEAENQGVAAEPDKPRHYQRHRHPGHHSCFKFFGCFSLMIIIVLACVVFLTITFTGPIIKTVDDLPKDFPKDLVIYQLNQADIKVLSPQSRAKVAQVSAALPNWSVQLMADYLYPDLKTQIIAQNKTPNDLPANPTVKDIKALSGNKASSTKTVTLSWNNINKTKEDLYAYYKEQLEAKGFTVNKLSLPTEIDLSFFKNGINGAMSLADSFSTDGASMIKMTVDYLSKQ